MHFNSSSYCLGRSVSLSLVEKKKNESQAASGSPVVLKKQMSYGQFRDGAFLFQTFAE
jgi:hypothetical protein